MTETPDTYAETDPPPVARNIPEDPMSRTDTARAIRSLLARLIAGPQ